MDESCDQGGLELVTRDEKYPMTDGSRKVLPRINYLRCKDCGDEVLTAESVRYISSFDSPSVDNLVLWKEFEQNNKGLKLS